MNEKAVELLGQYEIEVRHTRKGRGAVICETDQGCMVFREYSGSEERLELQDRLLRRVAQKGLVNAERIVPDREGRLCVKDGDGVSYILKTWNEGRECSIHDREECGQAVRLLARLHKSMKLDENTEGIPGVFSPEGEYERHNRELKRVRKYLKQKGQKTWFEINLRNHFDLFLDQALNITEEWKHYSRLSETGEEPGQAAFCHGDYQYHNILRDSRGWFVTGFEKCVRDNPARDLCLLLRKLLEKGGWSVSLGSELLEEYQKECPLSAGSWIDLYYRLAYPEKFWKIVNFYYNSGKAWIPGRNQEKLEKIIVQEKEKQHFLDEVFRKVGLG